MEIIFFFNADMFRKYFCVFLSLSRYERAMCNRTTYKFIEIFVIVFFFPYFAVVEGETRKAVCKRQPFKIGAKRKMHDFLCRQTKRDDKNSEKLNSLLDSTFQVILIYTSD